MPHIKTRFAPSPTGFLHIGGARTALFNWLFARHHGGEFYLRIEDTDRERSTQAAIDAIIDGMVWLGLKHDGEIIYQFARKDRHAEVAHALVAAGKAYYCYATHAEIEAFRASFPHQKFKSSWRDGGIPPEGISPSIRIKAPLEGKITIADHVQGTVSVDVSELDDMILLRSDGTPTYMLAVVVDDHDMGITHVIRGDDHFTNSFRQTLIYQAMGWHVPEFAHVPLIHGPDGAKLSKRHGALGVEAYRDMGYVPEAIRNYLLRLGWSHGDDEIISTAQAIEWFNLDSIGKSPSRFDFAKLENLNGHYIREMVDATLAEMVSPLLHHSSPTPHPLLIKALPALKQRAKTLVELAENAAFLFTRPTPDEAAAKAITDGKAVLQAIIPKLESLTEWNHDILQALCKALGEEMGLKLGVVMSPLRAAITGKTASPSMFEVMEWLGKEETLARLSTAC